MPGGLKLTLFHALDPRAPHVLTLDDSLWRAAPGAAVTVALSGHQRLSLNPAIVHASSSPNDWLVDSLQCTLRSCLVAFC